MAIVIFVLERDFVRKPENCTKIFNFFISDTNELQYISNIILVFLINMYLYSYIYTFFWEKNVSTIWLKIFKHVVSAEIFQYKFILGWTNFSSRSKGECARGREWHLDALINETGTKELYSVTFSRLRHLQGRCWMEIYVTKKGFLSLNGKAMPEKNNEHSSFNEVQLGV